MKRVKKKFGSMIAISTFPAIMWASFSIYALAQNNNQGEAFDPITGVVRYRYIFKLFVLDFLVIFIAVFVLLMIARLTTFLFDAIFGEEPPKE
jgi:hypothetical protein